MMEIKQTNKKYVFESFFIVVVFALWTNIYTMHIDRISINSTLMNIVLCCFLIFFSLLNYKNIKFNKLHCIWLFTLLGIYISSIFSLNRSVSFEYFFRFGIGILIMFLLSFNVKGTYKSIKFIQFFSIIYLIFTYLQLISFNAFYSIISNLFNYDKLQTIYNLSVYSNRYVGLGIFAGNNAFILNVGFGIYFSFLILNKGNRMNNIILMLFFACGIFLTGSRIMIVNMLISTFLIILVRSKGILPKLKKIIVFSLVVFIGVTVIVLIVPQAKAVFERFVNGSESINNRFLLYDFAFSLFKSKLLFGTGINTFVGLTYFNPVLIEKTYVHNIFLQLLCETGIIGSILILSSFFILYVKTIKLVKVESFEKSIKVFLTISLYLQTSFIIYFLTGNPLYDYNMLLTYFIISSFPIGIYSSIKFKKSGGEIEKKFST